MNNYLLPAALFGTVALVCQVQSAQALSAIEIGKIAKQSTVRIESENSPGSGVIIQKDGNTYTVLTAAHVVRNRKDRYKIVTTDGSEEKVSEIKLSDRNIDLAAIKFTSSNTYPVPKLAPDSSEAVEGSTVYVSGFPVTAAIDQAVFNFTEGKVTANSARPMSDGYSLVYSNNTLPGHSGGPVWNDRGEIVAIHGRGDIDTKQTKSEINPNIRVKTGFNLGISTNTFMQQAAAMGVTGFAPIAGAANPPRPVDEYLVSGLAKMEKLDFDGAIADFDRVIQLDPKKSAAYLYRGRAKVFALEKKILDNQSRTSELLTVVFKEALVSYDGRNSNQANYGLATYQKLAPEYDAALADLAQAYQLDPSSSEAYAAAGQVYSDIGKYAPAEELLTKSIKIRPNGEAFAVRASIKADRGDLPGALADSNESIKREPKQHKFYAVRADIYEQLNNYPKAIQEYDRSIQLTPASENFYLVQYYIRRGQAKSHLKQYSNATADISQSIAINNSRGLDSFLYTVRSSIALEQEKYPIAVNDLTQAIRLDAKNYLALILRSASYLYLKQYDPALRDINMAIALEPNLPESYVLQGTLLTLQSKFPPALQSFDQALQLTQDNPSKKYLLPDLYYGRGALKVATGQKSAGIVELEKAANLYRQANNLDKYREIMTQIQNLR